MDHGTITVTIDAQWQRIFIIVRSSPSFFFRPFILNIFIVDHKLHFDIIGVATHTWYVNRKSTFLFDWHVNTPHTLHKIFFRYTFFFISPLLFVFPLFRFGTVVRIKNGKKYTLKFSKHNNYRVILRIDLILYIFILINLINFKYQS